MEASFRAQDVSTSEERLVQGDAEMEIPAHGPAVGVGYSQPFGGSFFATVNLSGLYMWSKLDELTMGLDSIYT